MAAQATEDPDRDEETVQVVEFEVGGERFAVDVGDIDSIEELEGSTRVPRTGEAIAGVMDLRGEITAILDPSVHLDVPGDPAADPQVLVLDHSKDKQKLGLRVGEVYGVEEYRESLLSDTDDVPELDTAGVGEQAIAALLRRPSEESEFEPVGLIDVDELVRLSRQF